MGSLWRSSFGYQLVYCKNCPLFDGDRWVIVNPLDPIVLVSESTNDAPIPKVSSWFIGDFGTGKILSHAIDCGDTNGCLADGCSPSVSPSRSSVTNTPSSSPSHVSNSSYTSSLPTTGPTIEPIFDRCVTVTIACDTS